MDKRALEIIRCPGCKGELELVVENVEGDRVLDGILICGKCKEEFWIVQGIPKLLMPSFSSSS